ncbi:uncharacterized protein [Elaeis guineensis]|uniref:uncharacterized protein isoform X2 n=1 Tax=Elaeis guineensis var. tenera TaxID=51953 RepID=UPI003C6D1EF9
MATLPAAAPIAARFRSPFHLLSSRSRRWGSFRDSGLEIWKSCPLMFPQKCERRRTLIYAVGQDAEKSFKATVEVDRLIDLLRDSTSRELEKLVVENVLAFNENFWIRLAARTDTCKSDDDKKDYDELAVSLMSMVDRLVHKTNEKIESATDVLKTILNPVMDEVEEISWPPKDPKSLILMEKAKEDGDKPGLEAMLQKVLQVYASKILRKRSYAYKGEVLAAEKLLESIIEDFAKLMQGEFEMSMMGELTFFLGLQIKQSKEGISIAQSKYTKELLKRFGMENSKPIGTPMSPSCKLDKDDEAPEDNWNMLLIKGLSVGKGEVSPEEFYAVIKKRIERILIRTEGGSYQQRILVEYLKGIKSRSEEIVQAVQGPQQ